MRISLNIGKVARRKYIHDVFLDGIKENQMDVREGFLSEKYQIITRM